MNNTAIRGEIKSILEKYGPGDKKDRYRRIQDMANKNNNFKAKRDLNRINDLFRLHKTRNQSKKIINRVYKSSEILASNLNEFNRAKKMVSKNNSRLNRKTGEYIMRKVHKRKTLMQRLGIRGKTIKKPRTKNKNPKNKRKSKPRSLKKRK